MKLQESKGRFSLTIPSDYVTLLGWQKGHELIIVPSGKEEELIIKTLPMKNNNGKTLPKSF